MSTSSSPATALPESTSVILTSNAYCPAIGGVENSLRYLAQAYQQADVPVSIITTDAHYTPDYDDHGLDVTRVAKYSGLFGALRHWYQSYQTWRRAYNNAPNAHVIARYHLAVLMARWVGYRKIVYVVPSVVKFEYKPPTHLLRRLKHHTQCLLQTLAGKLAQRVYVFSDTMQQQCGAIGIRETLRAQPGVDPSIFSPVAAARKVQLRTQYQLPTDQPILLALGRLVTNKGFDLAIQALVNIPQVHLVIVGEGEAEAALQALARASNVNSRVHFIGATSEPEHFYQLADVFVFSSVYEPFGQTLLEASCCQLPTVAFVPSKQVDTATAAVLGQERVHWVAQPQPTYLAIEINSLLLQPEQAKRIARQAHEHVIRTYAWSVLAMQLLSLSKGKSR